jgi:hypothetical protein
MSRLKVLDAKSQPSLHCPIFRQLARFRANDTAPPITEWLTNEQEDLAPPAFIRLKPSQPEFQETIVDVWRRRCILYNSLVKVSTDPIEKGLSHE